MSGVLTEGVGPEDEVLGRRVGGNSGGEDGAGKRAGVQLDVEVETRPREWQVWRDEACTLWELWKT